MYRTINIIIYITNITITSNIITKNGTLTIIILPYR